MAPAEARRLKSVALENGIALDVWEEGPKGAPALIFLHGFPESHRTWRHQIAHFAGRYRCIAPDQRGYGGSSKPADVEAYATPRLAADVLALADALGIERFTVLGHDWGGVVAWVAAAMGQASGRIASAVIANAPIPGLFQRLLHLDPAQRAASQYMRRFRDTSKDAVVLRRGLAPLLREVFASDAQAAPEPEEAAALLKRWRDGEASLAMLNWYRASPIDVPAMDAPFALTDSPAPPSLPRLAMPTLVLWGLEDSFLLPANLDGLEEVAEHPRIVRIPGCGHFSPWQAPADVNTAIEAFLGEPLQATEA